MLSSISHPHLRVLILVSNRLNVEGEELKAALTRLPHLRILDLNDSGLGEELLCGLYDQLVQVVEALPQLRVLVIGNCQLSSSAVCSILERVNIHIEVIEMHNNGPVTDRKPLILDHINECKSLTYMAVSSSQFSKSELSQLNSLLSAHGGSLLVDDSDQDLYDRFIKHMNRIRDECLSI